MVYQNEFPAPRLGQGAFAAAVQAVYEKARSPSSWSNLALVYEDMQDAHKKLGRLYKAGSSLCLLNLALRCIPGLAWQQGQYLAEIT